MNQSFSVNKRQTLRIGAVAVVLIAIAYFCWPLPNSIARSRVETVLRSGAPPQIQLQRLEPYVKAGDSISTVRTRLSPMPDEQPDIERPTEWTLPLSHANLVLAVNGNGTVVGIGRQLYDIDDGTVWLCGPDW